MGKVKPEPLTAEKANLLLDKLKNFMSFLSPRKLQMISTIRAGKPKSSELENDTLLYKKSDKNGEYLSVKVEDIKTALWLLPEEARLKRLESIRKRADKSYEHKIENRWIEEDVFNLGHLDPAKLKLDRANQATAGIREALTRQNAILPTTRIEPEETKEAEVKPVGIKVAQVRRIMVAPLNKKASSRSF